MSPIATEEERLDVFLTSTSVVGGGGGGGGDGGNGVRHSDVRMGFLPGLDLYGDEAVLSPGLPDNAETWVGQPRRVDFL